MTTPSTPPFPHNDPPRKLSSPNLGHLQPTLSAVIRSVLFLLPCLYALSSLAQTTYLESGGQVVIEAEHFASKSTVSGRSWELVPGAPAGASQAGSMQNLPNAGITISTSIATTSPVLAFSIQFTTPGTYNYWIRAWGASGSDDSVYLGVNGTPGTSSVSFGATGSWVWKSRSVTIPASGTQQVGIWMREDGAYIDRILLTTNLTFTPTGTGPAESALASGPAPNTPPQVQITSPSNGATLEAGVATLVSASASDPGGSVSQVAFLTNGTPLATVSAPPYQVTWTPSLGSLSLSAIATDNLGLTATNTITVSAISSGSSGPFLASAGQVVIEAENFASKSATTHAWEPRTTPTGFVGTAAMQSSPNSGVTISANIATTSPSLTFKAQFASAGSYNFWVRGRGATGSDDSLFVGINQVPNTSSLTVSPTGSWVWKSRTVTIPSAGIHDLNVWMREDGVLLDRILLTTNLTFTPSGNGPAESLRSLPSNVAPAIQLVLPLNGTNTLVGTPLSLASNPSDTDGFVVSVTYRTNGVALTTVVTPPFTASWMPSAPGTYVVTALATDDDGADSPLSNAATVTVSAPPNQPPSISLVSPVNGTNVVSGTTLSLAATTSDPDGTVTSVRYFIDGVLLGSPVGSPFISSWTPLVPGTYLVTALATDDDGADSPLSTAVSVTVSAPPNQPPSISLTAPLDGTNVVTGTTLSLEVSASDPDGTVTSVRYFIDGILLGSPVSPPFTSSWTPLVPGTYLVTALATDDDGADSPLSTAVSFTVSAPPNQPPSITLTAPLDGTNVVTGTTLSLEVSTSDPDGTVTSVRYFIDGILLGSPVSPPFTSSWTPLVPGTYLVTALATDDDGADSPLSTAVSVTVSNPPNQPPSISLTAPIPGTNVVVGTHLVLAADATDPDGNISEVVFLVNATPVATVMEWPYEFEWTPAEGTYSISAVATDNSGASTPSATAPVTVSPPSNQIPTVLLTAPPDDSIFDTGDVVSMHAVASDPDGTVVQVTFFANSVEIGMDPESPYEFDWQALTPGAFEIVAVATDNQGATGASVPSLVIVTPPPNQPPTVALTAPLPGTSVPAGNPVTVSANAFDTDGTVTQVRFTANGVQIGLDTSAPYSISWTPNPGVYTLVAEAVDDDFETTVSDSVGFTATPGVNTPPTVQITSPGNRTSFAVGTPITVNVTASDIDGAVTQVQLYANGNVVGTRNAAPFTFSWSPSAGTYVVVAVATDNLGATTTSAVVLVRATSPAFTVAGTRWANTSNRMYFELGGIGSLADIKFTSSTAPLDIIDPVNMTWLARANIFITNSTLRLHGTSIGGDVNELRLQSNDASASTNVVSIIADYGTISIHSTKITSWNTIHGGPDTEYNTYGRAFLRARSRLAVEGNPASAPLESRMDIVNSDIGYLGAHIAESYGIVLKVLGDHSVITNLFELVQVRGNIFDSKIHHNYFGVYTYGAQDCHWARNEVYSNVQYGFDPHDDSDFLIIEDNDVHHNGNHGIIASRRCDNLIIRNNRSYANRLNGIMLHRHCAFSLISSNLTYLNGDSGIAIFDTDKTLIIGNTVLSNANAGIRFSMGSADNRIESNLVGHSGEYGFYFFQGSDPAEPDPYDPAVSNRNRRNLFVNNLVYNTVLDPIKMTDGDTNSFIGNVFTNNGNTFRFTNSRGNQFASNSIPDTALFALNGTASLPTLVSFEGQDRIKMDLPGAYGGGLFTDDAGFIFDFDESALSTSVDPAGSFVSLTPVTVGAGTTVVRRNLRVTLPDGAIGVNTTEWGTNAPYAKRWTTSPTTGTEVVTYRVGDLLPGGSYSVFRDNAPLLTGLVADASGSIEFTHATVGTLPAVYLVTP